MTLILGIDPGVESPGYAVWCTEQQRHVYVSADPPPQATCVTCAAAVVESGFIGRIGKLGMWGLGFGAGWRLSAVTFSGHSVRAHTIRPDGKSGWRAALPPKPGTFREYDGNDKDVIVKRLRHRYQAPADWTDDMVEACGIAEAAATILARPTRRSRQALKPVRF